jgi:hypothetical protein
MIRGGGFNWSLFFFYLAHWGTVLVGILVSFLVLVFIREGLDFGRMFFGSVVVAVVSSLLMFLHLAENEVRVEEKAAILVLRAFFYGVVIFFFFLL